MAIAESGVTIYFQKHSITFFHHCGNNLSPAGCPFYGGKYVDQTKTGKLPGGKKTWKIAKKTKKIKKITRKKTCAAQVCMLDISEWKMNGKMCWLWWLLKMPKVRALA